MYERKRGKRNNTNEHISYTVLEHSLYNCHHADLCAELRDVSNLRS